MVDTPTDASNPLLNTDGLIAYDAVTAEHVALCG